MIWMRALLVFLAPVFALGLGGCGLKPLYEGGASGKAAGAMAAIEIAPIEGKAGWLMGHALGKNLGACTAAGGAVKPIYRLDVLLDDKLDGLGALSDDTIGRERRTLRARYQLVDLSNGEIILDRTAGSDAGIDVVSSEYATIAAEDRALENLVTNVAARITEQLALTLQAKK